MEVSILRKRFFDTAVADILRAIDGRSLVGAVTLALCVIDYLAYLRPVCRKTGDNYKAFLEDFLVRFEPRYNKEWIYALRCALVHTYAQADAMERSEPRLDGYLLRHLDPTFHLSGSDNILRLNVESFVTDIVWLAWRFFNSLPDNPQEVEENGDELLVVGISDSQADKPYKNMHRALRELDKDSPRYEDLCANIRQAIMEPTSGGLPTTSGGFPATGSGESSRALEGILDFSTPNEFTGGSAIANGFPYSINDASECD